MTQPTIPPGWALVPDGDPVSLLDCPPGPFAFNGTLAFRTEYGAMSGKDVGGGKVEWTVTHWPDAYCLDTGEAFWGGAATKEDRGALIVQPLAAAPVPPEEPTIAGEREAWDHVFWLIVREPGRVPDRCGPYRNGTLAATIRETMRVRPTALIDVLTIGYLGPEVQHGPEALQMLDGRSMSTGRKHNARTREAFNEYLARPSVRDGEIEQIVAPPNGEPDPEWRAIKRAIDQFVGRVPSISKHRATNNEHVRQLVERLDAAGDKEAADTIVWQAWYRALDSERTRFLLADKDERIAALSPSTTGQGDVG